MSREFLRKSDNKKVKVLLNWSPLSFNHPLPSEKYILRRELGVWLEVKEPLTVASDVNQVGSFIANISFMSQF